MLLNKHNWKIYQISRNVFSAAKDKIEKLIAISHDLCLLWCTLVVGIRAIDLYSSPVSAVGFLLAIFHYTPHSYETSLERGIRTEGSW